ncbi:MAG: alpha/beta hydrolase, partial [Actinomycetota bacterium]|nr:alpha/beta hydrolase [Actinomycetota bacterium]
MPRPKTAPAVILSFVTAASVLAGCTSSSITGTGSTSGSSPSSSAASAPGSQHATSSPPQPAAHFTDCRSAFNLSSLSYPSGREQRLSVSCATIDVPLDYAMPGGRQVSLQLVKIHDSANTAKTGSLLVNPGGPGGSGVELGVGLSAQLSDSIMSHFDIIGFDPRGVGSSTPIRCLSDKQKDELNAASPDILTPTGFEAARQQARTFATACNNKIGSALADFDTVQTARDMEQIRKAVGDPQMNYLGFSYGTELGSIYAHLFPKHIRVAVLDGAVNPLSDDITSFADQLKGFEGAFDQFAAYCSKAAPCSSLGDPRQAVYKLAAKATASPIPSSTPGETRKATSSLVYTGVLSALYSQSLWPALGDALQKGLAGDSQGILSLADRYNERVDGHYSNISDANATISCNDSKPGPTDATILATAKSWKKRFPIFGLWSAPSLFGCQQWQPHRTPVPLPTAATPNKVLVVGNLNDPATPYQGAKNLAKTMGNTVLLTWDGEGHTSYLQG